MMKFTQHFPGYMDFEPESFTFERTGELLENPLLDHWKKQKGFHGFFLSYGDVSINLMALFDYKEEYYGCTKWYCIGTITNDTGVVVLNNTMLPDWRCHQAIHKPNCWSRKYKSVFDDTILKTEEQRLRILKELGWKSDSTFGSAECDCGLEDL